MHVHKPKPLHGWRELLTEMGVIIAGILIALALEQGVEAFRVHEAVGAERAALKAEVGALRASMQVRYELEPCFAARLAQVKAIITRHDTGKPLGIVGRVGRPLYPTMQRPTWELAVADQSLAHMSLAEKRRFMDAYNWVDIFDKVTTDERQAWRSLQALNEASVLTPADWSQVRRDYEQALGNDEIIWGSRAVWTPPLDALQTKAEPQSVRQAPPVVAFCTPMVTGVAAAPAAP